MSPLHLLAGLLLPTLASATGAGGLPYPCYQAPSPPVIDGEVAGDPVWQALPSVTGFRVLGGGYAKVKQTSARACWDGDAVYVAMVCDEPDTASLKPIVRDGGPTWLEDSVEVFLQPKPGGLTYQFGVTAGGAIGAFEGNPDFTRCRAAARIGAGSYSIELRVPFEVVDARPTVGSRWAGTFCRNTLTPGEAKFTCWAPLQTRFFEPESYLPIEFLGQAPGAEEAVRQAERLNARYRASLVRDLRLAAGQGQEYLAPLAEAARDARFAEPAGAVCREWQEMARLGRDAQRAPLGDLRRAIARVGSLVTRSYELKYEYLTARLFDGE